MSEEEGVGGLKGGMGGKGEEKMAVLPQYLRSPTAQLPLYYRRCVGDYCCTGALVEVQVRWWRRKWCLVYLRRMHACMSYEEEDACKVVFGLPEGRDRLFADAFDHVPAVDRWLAFRVGFKVQSSGLGLRFSLQGWV